MLWTGALRIKARDIESARTRARAHIASRPRPRVLFDERRGTQRSEFNRSTFFWCCIAKTVRNMSQIMRLRKVCPQCGTTVHVKRSRCACGHYYTAGMVQPNITTCTLGLATVVITLWNLASFPSYSCLVYNYDTMIMQFYY